MKETSPDQTYIDRIRFWASTEAHGGSRSSSRRPDTRRLPLSQPRAPYSIQLYPEDRRQQRGSSNGGKLSLRGGAGHDRARNREAHQEIARDRSRSPRFAPSQAEGEGAVLDPPAENEENHPNLLVRFFLTTKQVLFHSWLNVLLVFVPVGIIVGARPGLQPGIVFSMNAVAIIPLAGLLSYATESVAHEMGDSVGALLNITFGNAVELIIFIALVKDEIRIVQASLLGSILANLLLILGMGFLLGGLRYREQIYNSTVTQMSACLLSLSVISLVLPTAFHASFADTALADAESLKISRGTSVILLLVYILYLLFQLKSHAYMYESMPQRMIDEESAPGPVANWLDSSSSDDDSSSDSTSGGSSHSRETVTKKMRRIVRGGRRRRSSIVSQETAEIGPRTPSFGTANVSPAHEEPISEQSSARPALQPTVADQNEDVNDDEKPQRRRRRRHRPSLRHIGRHKKRSSRMSSSDMIANEQIIDENPETTVKEGPGGAPRRVDFAISEPVENVDGIVDAGGPKRPFNIHRMSFRPVAKSLAPTVFTQPLQMGAVSQARTGPIPRIRYGIRRTNSLPDRLNEHGRLGASSALPPSQVAMETPLAALANPAAAETPRDEGPQMSRTAALVLLLITTGLVALCADFMVDSINGLVATSHVREIFIGLIILPIVGNAAEHVTAVVVAMKNKMDLAIGVAVGSSIQIALFITPFIVILGWILDKDMTLYFTLFETVCLFVSAFIVNFLVLDGRSNYLEGALLCATYIIISVVAFYYPDKKDASQYGQ